MQHSTTAARKITISGQRVCPVNVLSSINRYPHTAGNGFDRHDFLYNAGHNLQGQRRAGEDQHGEIEQAGDYTGGFRVPGDSPHHQPDTQGGHHCQQPASQKLGAVTVICMGVAVKCFKWE